MRRRMCLSFLLVLLCAPHGIAAAVSCSECHLLARCEEHAAYVKCVCKDGFVGDGFSCSDIDECAHVWTHKCSAGTCQNTFGSYTCLCPSGFIFSEGSCVPTRQHDDRSLNRVDPLAQCPDGYNWDGVHCEADPCVNHIVLDEPWRSVNYPQSSNPNCDKSKNGWYRFVGSGGIRVPEYCVSRDVCNTAATMWMKGTHPVIRDGIVNRTACASWDNCCFWTYTIQVKACPLGYHVYKIMGTPWPGCKLSFCTDPLAVQGFCAANEEWILGDKGGRCSCKDQYKVSRLSDIRPELTCGLNEMRASFQKCQMKDLDTYFGPENIKDSGCFDFEDNDSTNTFSVLAALHEGGCGVQTLKNGSHVTYRSTIAIKLHTGAIIMKNDTLTITLSCVYALDMITSLNLALRPIISSLNIAVGGTVQFQTSMVLYKDSSYTTPYEGLEVSLPPKAILYIGAFIQAGDASQYVLVMRNCYATPTQSANDALKYYIIKDSCPNKQDESINVLENGVSRQGRVSVQMSKLMGDYNRVYLHCAVSLCEVKSGVCQPTCNSRSRRSELDSHNLRIGPIIRSAV